jgi:glycosyltransferase involved in cell wall biosynthesis
MQTEKTAVIPNSIYLSRGSGHISLPDQILNCQFLLCVAQHRANKNLPLLLRSFRLALDRNLVHANAKLVLVGKEGPETQLIHQVIEQNSLGERVLLLRGITDGLLLSLYEHCELVVAPSLLEGFGLPVAEALAAGSRVACSDIPAFRSIGASRCTFFDPMDSTGESLVAAVQKAIAAPRVAAVFAAALDPRRAAAMYLALYSRLLLNKQTRPGQSPAADLPTSSPLSDSIHTATSERHSL